jgi:hypothetical protein
VLKIPKKQANISLTNYETRWEEGEGTGGILFSADQLLKALRDS